MWTNNSLFGAQLEAKPSQPTSDCCATMSPPDGNTEGSFLDPKFSVQGVSFRASSNTEHRIFTSSQFDLTSHYFQIYSVLLCYGISSDTALGQGDSITVEQYGEAPLKA